MSIDKIKKDKEVQKEFVKFKKKVLLDNNKLKNKIK